MNLDHLDRKTIYLIKCWLFNHRCIHKFIINNGFLRPGQLRRICTPTPAGVIAMAAHRFLRDTARTLSWPAALWPFWPTLSVSNCSIVFNRCILNTSPRWGIISSQNFSEKSLDHWSYKKLIHQFIICISRLKLPNYQGNHTWKPLLLIQSISPFTILFTSPVNLIWIDEDLSYLYNIHSYFSISRQAAPSAVLNQMN